jgi:hypothetical protein
MERSGVRKSAKPAKARPKRFVLHCHECGDVMKFKTEYDFERYINSGMCEKCEQKALGGGDQVVALLEVIIGKLARIEKRLSI